MNDVRRGGDEADATRAPVRRARGRHRSSTGGDPRGRRTRAVRRPRRAARRRPQYSRGRQAPGSTPLARACRSRRRRRTARRSARPRRVLRPRWTVSAAVFTAHDRDSRFGCGRSGNCRRVSEACAGCYGRGSRSARRACSASAVRMRLPPRLRHGDNSASRQDRGSGNRYVAAAKAIVAADCGIDFMRARPKSSSSLLAVGRNGLPPTSWRRPSMIRTHVRS